MTEPNMEKKEFNCPICKEYNPATFKRIKADFSEDKKIKGSKLVNTATFMQDTTARAQVVVCRNCGSVYARELKQEKGG